MLGVHKERKEQPIKNHLLNNPPELKHEKKKKMNSNWQKKNENIMELLVFIRVAHIT